MKTILTILIVILTNSYIGQFNNDNGDNIQEYRVVAYKNIDNSIQSVSNIVNVAKKLHLQVPNAFSPDGDGVNDEFMVIHNGVEEFSMRIYNRWGELVYQTDDIKQPWNGVFKGSNCQQDAYVYVIKARGLEDREATTMKGTVSLIR